jgi:hypothetical protein
LVYVGEAHLALIEVESGSLLGLRVLCRAVCRWPTIRCEAEVEVCVVGVVSIGGVSGPTVVVAAVAVTV